MTKEQAIKMAEANLECIERETSGTDEMCSRHGCDECSLNYEQGNMGEQKEWLRMAIEALEQKPCEDAISRKEVLQTFGELLGTWGRQALMEMPSVTPTHKKGKWIVEVWNNKEHHTCSSCQHVIDYEPCYHYCPYCGTEMEVKE